MDFLNNFDPTAVNNDGNPEFAVSESGRDPRGLTIHEHPDPRQATFQDPRFSYIHPNGSVRHRIDDQLVRQHTASLPLGESERFGLSDHDYQSRIYHQPLLGQVEESRAPRGVVIDPGYVDDPSRTYPRSREDFYTTRTQDQARSYQEFGYEPSEYYEERFVRPVSRYEAVPRAPMEGYRQQLERSGDRFVDMYRARQQMATEEEGYMSRRDGRARYVPLNPRYYDQAEGLEYAQPVRERHITYANYNDAQYVREETLEAGQLVRPGQRDLRPHDYRPGDEDRRYMTR
jgi:hypothetical protein